MLKGRATRTTEVSDVHQFPVSVKGVLFTEEKRAPLLLNERGEWELPGGKLEANEHPCECVTREIAEELGVSARACSLLNSWNYAIGRKNILIITYFCRLTERAPSFGLSAEHKAFHLFGLDELASLNMPTPYKEAITLGHQLSAHSDDTA